jgi:hypothetical protein
MPLDNAQMMRDAEKLKWRLARYRALIGFYLVALAQFLSPAAAADPASKINPPAWSHHHSPQEIQAYGLRARSQEPEKRKPISRVRLRQILEDQSPFHSPQPKRTAAAPRDSRLR